MVESTKNNNPTGKPELDDIFAEEDEPAIPTPAANTPQIKNNANSQPVASPEVVINYDNEESDVLGKVKKYFVIGLVALLVIVIIGGVIWYRQTIFGWIKQHFNLSAGKNTPTLTTNQVKTNQNQGAIQTTVNNTKVGNPAPSQVTQPTDGTADSDGDGLTDAEEKTYGTDPKKVDTDNDGLFDREEIKVYHTNPLNPDTDGDGHTDGDEVKLRFNPRGTGTLEQMPKN
jgi:hypothetical protein